MLKAILISLCIFSSYAQEAQRSPYASQYMYYFYSKSDDMKFKDICDKLGIKQGKLFLIVGRDTVQMTQANDSLRLHRNVSETPTYLGKGKEDFTTFSGVNSYIHFKEFVKP